VQRAPERRSTVKVPLSRSANIITRMENIDSRIPSFGFCYCLLQRIDGSLADFCNTIDPERTSMPHARTSSRMTMRVGTMPSQGTVGTAIFRC
jgi:hypothetical protein